MPYKKTTYRKKKATTKIGKRLKKIETKLAKTVVNTRYRFQNYGIVTTGTMLTFANPLIHCMNAMPQGDNEVNFRQGDKAKFGYLNMNIEFFRTNTVARAPVFVRCLLVREITSLGSDIGLVQYFNSATPAIGDVRNIDTRDHKRFVTYYDRTFVLGGFITSTATTALYNPGASPKKSIKINKKLKFTTDYSRGTGGTISDIDTNGLFLICITDNTSNNEIDVYTSYSLSFVC